MKEYEEMILKNLKERLKMEYCYEMRISKYGDKITLDGMNFFNEISEVEILSHNEVIIKYDLKNKKFRIRKVDNVILEKDIINFLNHYVGSEIYFLGKEGKKRLIEIEEKKDEIYEMEGSCDLSDYEVSQLLMFEKECK